MKILSRLSLVSGRRKKIKADDYFWILNKYFGGYKNPEHKNDEFFEDMFSYTYGKNHLELEFVENVDEEDREEFGSFYSIKGDKDYKFSEYVPTTDGKDWVLRRDKVPPFIAEGLENFKKDFQDKFIGYPLPSVKIIVKMKKK